MRFSNCLFLVFMFVGLFSIRANNNYDIKNISTLEGLSKNTVNKICVDRIGNVWIGTSYGLNRYDGRTVETYYHHNKDSNSLQSSNIYDIYESENGVLWIVTTNGVCRYNYANNNFSREKFGSWIRDSGMIMEDAEYIWFFGNPNKIFRIKKLNNEIEVIKIESNYLLRNIKEVIEYNDETFLFITTWEGVFLMDKNTRKVESFFETKGERLVEIQKTKQGYFLASRKNLYHLSNAGKIVNHLSILYSELNNPIVLGLKYNKWNNTIYLLTDGDGIFVFDSNLKLLQNVKSNKGVNGILPDNSVRDALLYDEKTIFAGTVRAGVAILYESQFKEYRQLSGSEFGTITNSINSISEDEKGLIWLGTDGGGLKSFDVKENSFSSYYHPEVSKITSIVNYTNKYLLVASYLKGLFLFDKQKKEFISSKNHPVLRNIDTDGQIRIFEDSEHNVWIGIGAGLFLVNTHRGEISTPLVNSSITGHLKKPTVFVSAFETKNNEIWFCSYDGLLCYSLTENKFIDQIDLSGYPNIGGLVFGATENSVGDIVFGAGEGLYIYNKTTNEVANYLVENKQINRLYHSVYCNSTNQIWSGTTGGLIRIDPMDSTNNVIHFNQLGELGGNEYRHGALFYSSGDLLYMGSTNGLTIFNPEEIVFDDSESTVTVSSMTSNGVVKGNVVNNMLALNVSNSSNVEVKYSSASYNFKFNTFNFLGDEHTQYSYMLENFDDMWKTGNSHEASYSNLSPGEYIFRVKATNLNGIMGLNSTNIYLNILPAWYQTIWFKLLIVGLILVTSLLIWRESLNRVKLKNQLAFEKLEQDKLKEINQMKLRFFTNISHELKTPLTLILAPLEHLVRQKSSPAEMEKLFPFLYRNARRMNQLITQLLEFRKAEMSALELNLQKADLINDCREVLNHFKHQSEIESVSLQIESFEKSYLFVYDRDKLFKILFNLLGNALKYTSKNDKITVYIEQAQNNGVLIKVSDSGIGIAEDNLDSVFERFYMADHKESGTGIGLAFAKKLVELHNGEIKVESKVGEGTVFTISLPSVDSETQVIETESVLNDVQSEIHYIATETTSDKTELQILIVEDEWELRKYLVQLLSAKYRILEAKNGDEAIKIAIDKLPDLILSDLMMPVMDGYELCTTLKNDLRISHIPVVLLTAKTEIEHKLEGYKSGADAYVSKPFDNNILLSQIDAILQNRVILKERFSHDLDLKPEELSHSSEDEKFLHKAISIVEMNIENPGFGVPDFVEGIGMGRTLVYNKTKAITGKTINEFILHIRLRRAVQFLKETDNSITAIAISCGFSEQTYFSSVFKKHFGLSPTEYRKE